MEDPDQGVYLTPEKALQFLENLGYDDINKVPVGRGNDRLSAYVAIARGGLVGMDLNKAIRVMRRINNARENMPVDHSL